MPVYMKLPPAIQVQEQGKTEVVLVDALGEEDDASSFKPFKCSLVCYSEGFSMPGFNLIIPKRRDSVLICLWS